MDCPELPPPVEGTFYEFTNLLIEYSEMYYECRDEKRVLIETYGL